jgi:hypothetical protein
MGVNRSACRVLPESLAIAAICLLDTAWTVVVIDLGLALEANPMMAKVLERGYGWFVFVKLASFVPAIAILEYLRSHLPSYVRWMMRFGIVAYIGIYTLGSIWIHR